MFQSPAGLVNYKPASMKKPALGGLGLRGGAASRRTVARRLAYSHSQQAPAARLELCAARRAAVGLGMPVRGNPDDGSAEEKEEEADHFGVCLAHVAVFLTANPPIPQRKFFSSPWRSSV